MGRHPRTSLLDTVVVAPAAWIVLALLMATPDSLAGQSVYGRVLVAGDSVAIPAVDLVLRDSTDVAVARVQADDEGAFRLPVPAPGHYKITASRIGFSEVESSVLVHEAEAVEVRLTMAVAAVPLEPIVVVGRRTIRPGTLDEFYDRMARMKQRGKGRFLTLEELERRSAMPLPMLLQTLPGVWLNQDGRSVRLLNSGGTDETFCEPQFYLDGMPMLGGYRELQVMDLEGVEVYRGYSEVVHGYFPDQCGVILFWRKPDWGNPFTWKRAFLAAGLGAVLWMLVGLVGGS